MREEVEFLPSGLASCLLNGKEVRILKISPESITVRLAEEIDEISKFVVAFYIFNENRYSEVNIEDFVINKKKREEFYYTYSFIIKNQEYFQRVRYTLRDYSKYVMMKNYGYENQFSEEMVSYPAELDYDFYDYYINQKKEWMLCKINSLSTSDLLDSVELAIKIDNYDLYKIYLENDIIEFSKKYFRDNFIVEDFIVRKEINRVYIGNEFCHNLFPDIITLKKIMDKATSENLNITLCFTYMRECYIERIKKLLDSVYKWSKDNNKPIEIVINDWGMLKLLEDKRDCFQIALGVLLNKRKKDPRYSYKNGYKENIALISDNSLNISDFNEFLKSKGISRYEYESCGYTVHITEGNHSMHLPFYVTNTSQYCTLHAMCTQLDRGKQKLVLGCKMYCKDYVFAYPKHLKMVGRYNSLFAFDETLLKDEEKLSEYIKNGIDRIVLNFI